MTKRSGSEIGNEEVVSCAKKLKLSGYGLMDIPHEIIKHRVMPMIAKSDLISFLLASRSVYRMFMEHMKLSLYGVRMHYLNYTKVHQSNVTTVEYDDVARNIPPVGGVLINLLDKNLLDHEYFTGTAKEDMELLAKLSKRTSRQFETKLIDHIAYSKSNIVPNLLPMLFNWNRNNPDKPQFFVAGGSIASMLFNSKWDSDVDVFVMENGNKPSESHKALREILLQFSDRAKKDNINYGVVKNSATINIIGPEDPPIQFVLRRVNHIEELMTFFDLDCCRFAFDGLSLVTIRDGIRSTMSRVNLVSAEHKYTGIYMKRAVKYGHRDISTYFYTLHPLQHIYTLAQNVALFNTAKTSENNVLENAFSKNSGGGATDQDMYTPLANINYERIKSICTMGLEAFIQQEIDNEFNDDWSYLPFGCWRSFQEINNKDPHIFALSLREVYQRDYSKFFTEGYYDSHLREKYLLFRCYLCGIYEHLPQIIPSMTEEEEDAGEELDLDIPEYHMCHSCTEYNTKKRNEAGRDLTGQVAIVTGARIKIGYHVALRLLRAGATVVGTTRFVASAKTAFSDEKDYEEFKDRLILYPLNLKDGKSILAFVDYVSSKFERIHILINNAAQTVRRPLMYYEKLIRTEEQALKLTEGDNQLMKVYESKTDVEKFNSIADPVERAQHISLFATTCMNLAPEDLSSKQSYFPQNMYDDFGEQLDNRTHHSWTYTLSEVNDIELLEVQMVNQIAPTMLASKLMQKMKVSQNDTATGYIVNVTSHEGSFHTTGKTDTHIHTNISKAALNMLTRSAAPYYAKNGIVMVSADTGWVSSAISTFMSPPLTCEDGAARILDPVLQHSLDYGILLKNYKRVAW